MNKGVLLFSTVLVGGAVGAGIDTFFGIDVNSLPMAIHTLWAMVFGIVFALVAARPE